MNRIKDELWFIWLVLMALALFLISAISCSAQDCSNYFIADSLIHNNIKQEQIQGGSCASPDGPMMQTAAPPPSYAWLLANGYCYAIGPTRNFTMCFTFTSPGTDVSLNSGYSSSGCAIISFSGFNLYTCNPGCVLIGSGLSFSGLTPGQCYVWCFSGTCIGGPGPGFNHVCPYFQNTTPLPIELSTFECETLDDQSIELNWSTATESNNNYFEIQSSIDGINWQDIGTILGKGNSIATTYYKLIDEFPISSTTYYRLKQVDYNGQNTISWVISCYSNPIKVKVQYYNLLGQEVLQPTAGTYIKKQTKNGYSHYLKVYIQ